MKNRKFAKLAVVASALSLVMCCTMLLGGGTFAWFTDSVSSDVNTIQSGNLDVVVEYKTKWSDSWTTLDENTKLFNEDALYEPGYTEVVYLRMVNAGSLALQYELDFEVVAEEPSTNVYGDEFKLSDYLKIGAYVQDEFSSGFNYADILMPSMFGTREGALQKVTLSNIKDFAGEANTPILPGEQTSQVAAVVLTMPETVGNEANHKTGVAAPTITIGVNLVATQYNWEEDAFGPDYDENATAVPLAIVEDADEYENTNIPWKSWEIFPAAPASQQLESVYTFTAADDTNTVATSPYKDWNCDYYVSLSTDLEKDQLFLAGEYGAFGWIGFTVNQDMLDFIAGVEDGTGVLPAGQKVPLLKSFMQAMNVVNMDYWTYENVIGLVGTFNCGVADHNNALAGETITVELRLTNPNNPDEYKVASKVEYTF